MKLLLFLSALLTAMTGVVVGQAPVSATVHAVASATGGATAYRARPAATAASHPAMSLFSRARIAPARALPVGTRDNRLGRAPIYREKPRE